MLDSEAREVTGQLWKGKKGECIEYTRKAEGAGEGIQASGEERMTGGCKTVCQSAAKCETFITTKTKLQTWQEPHHKRVAVLAFQTSWGINRVG